MAPNPASQLPPGIDLWKIPLRQPPPGVIPNFVDPPTLASSIVAVSIAMMTLSTIFLALRLYSRLALIHVFGLDDYLLFGAYVTAVANTAVSIAETKYGLGWHTWDLTLGLVFPKQFILTWVGIKLYVVSLTLAKLAILCLYPRISPEPKFRMAIWALTGLVVAWGIATFFWHVFICSPVNSFWTLDLETGNICSSNYSFFAVTGSTNVVIDVILVILPIIMMWNVSLPLRKKISVAIVLSTGSLVSIISLIRLFSSIRIFASSEDLTYRTAHLFNWSSAELHTAVICACLPTLRPFFRKHFSILPGFSGNSNASKTPAIGTYQSRSKNGGSILGLNSGTHNGEGDTSIVVLREFSTSVQGSNGIRKKISMDGTSGRHILEVEEGGDAVSDREDGVWDGRGGSGVKL